MLWNGFLQSAKRFPDRPALVAQGNTLSYQALSDLALSIAATLQAHSNAQAPQLAAIFADRSATAFAGVLGILLSGRGYVPLNPGLASDRTRGMFNRSGCRAVIVDTAAITQLNTILDGAASTLVLVPEGEGEAVEGLRTRWPEHRFIARSDFEAPEAWREPPSDPDAIAYLLFTSGSTGIPKGVMVAHRNVTAFIDHMVDLYDVVETDRFSQMFQLTFDLSVFDMFVCWERGAVLCCPSPRQLLSPGRFIRESGLTIWFSVPSVVIFMKQFGALKPDSYPGLRLSLFCGEPLPVASAQAWRAAAPNAPLENLYGPTELTIACTRYRWVDDRSPVDAELGIAPIGEAYPGMTVLVANEALIEVEPGETGELLMTGPQMTLGYFNDSEKTAAAFVRPPERTETYYRTGDRVRRASPTRPMVHLGRLDFQIKVLGHRVELGEIEAVVREVSGMDGVIAAGWPATDSGFGGIEVFVEGDIDPIELRIRIGGRLPDYMTPRRIHPMVALPKNANGKFDRNALNCLLAGGV